jgi:type II secretory pathway pseudopilin PulG
MLFAAVIPVFVRMSAYKRNTQRISDVKNIATQVTAYKTKNGDYPETLKDLIDSNI